MSAERQALCVLYGAARPRAARSFSKRQLRIRSQILMKWLKNAGRRSAYLSCALAETLRAEAAVVAETQKSDGKASTALTTTTLHNFSTGACLHARPKTMCFCALTFLWLIGLFCHAELKIRLCT